VRLRRRQQPRAKQLFDPHHVIELLPREGHRRGKLPAINRRYGVERAAVGPGLVAKRVRKKHDRN
jgi:hypothetical protein